jgi:hypothetical protein
VSVVEEVANKKLKLESTYTTILLPKNVVHLVMSKLTPREITLYSRVSKQVIFSTFGVLISSGTKLTASLIGVTFTVRLGSVWIPPNDR